MIDGGLRKEFATRIPAAHMQSIETGGTGRGVPDTNYCLRGVEGWIEFKATKHWKIDKTESLPLQVAWIERRVRAGGRVFVVVRRAGSELWLLRPEAARALVTLSLRDLPPSTVLGRWHGGPGAWPWGEIAQILCS